MKKLFLLLILIYPIIGFSQPAGTITDESKVPSYVLPDILTSLKGEKIMNAEQWEKVRRPEILKIFQDQIYGNVPGELKISEIIVHEEGSEALNGLAIRKQVDLVFRKGKHKLSVGVLIYLPHVSDPVPVFLGCNFIGNHACSEDSQIRISDSWAPNHSVDGIFNNTLTEQSRGATSDQWPIESIIKNGFGVATYYSGDIDPDKHDFTDGIHPFFYKRGQTEPASDEWGTIAAWAWGLSRVLDYLEQDKRVDAGKVIVFGHSRMGKAATWAAASDRRFAACISNNSGCMGAALSRRKFGETVSAINKSFPHWFCENFKQYDDKEENLPIDQHMLLALIAPRPLYVASATEDLWADPKGEYLSAWHAGDVYKLYGLKGLTKDEMPAPDTPVSGVVSYHLRTGRHDMISYDWEQYFVFAKSIK